MSKFMNEPEDDKIKKLLKDIFDFFCKSKEIFQKTTNVVFLGMKQIKLLKNLLSLNFNSKTAYKEINIFLFA